MCDIIRQQDEEYARALAEDQRREEMVHKNVCQDVDEKSSEDSSDSDEEETNYTNLSPRTLREKRILFFSKCTAFTKKGNKCKRKATENGMCAMHAKKLKAIIAVEEGKT